MSNTPVFEELTHFPIESKQTDETYQTYLDVTNDDFLTAIFGGDFKLARPLVCQLAGDPGVSKGWPVRAWPCDTSKATLNWYALPSLFAPTEAGRYAAQAKLAGAVHCIMLDDIGTRVPLERLTACVPSWLIETSPDNFQAGYIFDAPVEKTQADALKAALIEAQLCDPGASGGVARWMRLPKAINGKAKYGTPAFKCVLTDWHPERRYTVTELFERLELAAPVQLQVKTKAKKTTTPRSKPERVTRVDDDVYTPRAGENAVVVALKNRGLYKTPIGSGKHDVTCPWVHGHTDALDHGSTYFEPSDLFPVGGYKCQHGHCTEHRIGALLESLGVSSGDAKHKPTIKISPGELHRIVDAAEKELADTARYYQRGGLIVAITTSPETSTTEIKPLSTPALLRALSQVAMWSRYDSRSMCDVVCDPPQKHVAVLFDSEGYNHLPALSGLARQPHLRRDGSLVREAGYDRNTGFFGVFDARKFSIPDQPTRGQAENALRELRELLGEFEFSKPHDQPGALAAMLSATIRPSLALAPMFHIRAPQIASGKSYLSSIIAAFSSPASPSAVAFPTNEEECQKLLLATLLSAPGAVVFDNLTTDLIPFKSLCSALTEEHLTGRILGVSKTATVGTRTLFLSSGNNVGPVRDMARRCITVALDPRCETPAAREFAGDPLAYVRANRERYVSLALTLIRAWVVADKPMTACKPLASFNQWSDWVRQPLLWLGVSDPAQSVFEQLTDDPDRELLGRVLHAWQSVFKNAPTMIRDAVTQPCSLMPDPELTDVLNEIAEERGFINRRRLGKWIARHQGRVVDGLKFERVRGKTSAEKWRVESVTSVSSVSFEANAKSVSV